jgi:Zn-dependent M28 family amino/carboxypeptidase
MKALLLPLALLAAAAAPARDADTQAWWRTTIALSNDAMEGRDTGSPGYDRAAAYVARRFAAAGLRPAGDDGGWLQLIPLEELAVRDAAIAVNGRRLDFLQDIMVAPDSIGGPLDLPIAYRGYCAPDALDHVRGKLVICHGSRRPGMPTAAERTAALVRGGAAAVAVIADPGFTIEPPRWPFAYARNVWIAGDPPPRPPLPSFTLNADALGTLLAGSGREAADLIRAGSAGQPVPSFDAPGRFTARFTLARRRLRSANVLGLLPGTDPALADQPIVLTAHLDGYGYGRAVNGDRLYNGTLDDAAYVALLIRLIERRHGRGFRRPLLLAAVTGEEKGLLGSRWLVAHRPAVAPHFVGDINLDQLRPIFPLRLLTVHGLDDSSLGRDARAVATAQGIEVQTDPEPERNLIRRADHWNFMQAGVPAVNFVFGFRPGSESERIYRHWYRTGYHRPQDDIHQPIDWTAAADFNRFFYALVERVANAARG